MPEFLYHAKKGGQSVEGSVTASNEQDAVATLRRQNLVVLSVRPTGGARKKTLWQRLTEPVGGRHPVRLKAEDFVVFSRQLSTMISAGIPLLESLEILHEQAPDPGFQQVLGEIVEKVRTGTDFSEALRQYPKVFTEVFTSMVRAGESSGQLDEILLRVAEYQESVQRLRGQVRAAMTYPMVSLFLILGITVFLLVGIIPRFEKIFVAMKIPLNPVTGTLLAMSAFLRSYWYLWFGVLTVLILGFRSYVATAQGRRRLDWIRIHVPIFGPLFRKVAISRFSRTFSTLISSGVPILGSLDIVASTAGNRIVEDAVREAMESVREGETLEAPLARSGVFPPMVTRMIAVGERTGSLESLLEKIAEFYDQQVSSSVETLTALVEPLLIVTMGLVVGGIVLAVFLPIFQLQSGMLR